LVLRYYMKRVSSLGLCIVAILLMAPAAGSQPRKAASQSNVKASETVPPGGKVNPDIENLRLQRDRLDFEREKSRAEAEREEKKLKIEESKVFWSAAATAGPFVIGIIAIVIGFWNQHRQNKHQFELKAAEIVFTGTTPQAVLSRGRALKAIFGSYLSRDFLGNFNPEEYGGYKEPSEEKRFFVEQILKDPTKTRALVELWFNVFPGDFRWLIRVDPDYFEGIKLPGIQKLLEEIKRGPEEHTVLPDKA
jgi:hypothetical protein